MRTLVKKWIHFLWRKCHHFDFRQGMGFIWIFEKKWWKKLRKLVRKWIHFFWRKCHHFDFRQGMGFTLIFEKKWWTTMQKLIRNWIHFFWRKCHHFNFRQGMGFTTIFEKNGEKNFENWPENEFCILPPRIPFVFLSSIQISFLWLSASTWETRREILEDCRSTFYLQLLPSSWFCPR